MSDWSSFEDDKQFTDKWREYLKEGKEQQVDELSFKGLKKGMGKAKSYLGRQGSKFMQGLTGKDKDYSWLPGAEKDGSPAQAATPVDAEEVPDEEPQPQIKKPGPPQPKQAPGQTSAGDEQGYIPISGTELKIMNHIAKSKGTDMFKVVRNTITSLGAATRNPEMVPIIKAFNSTLFPQIANLSKRVSTDVAESLDMEKFLNDLLQEIQGEPLTKRQQAQKKGVARAGSGALAYFKSMGGKPPMIARKIEKDLTKALIDGVDADLMLDAVATAGATIKDPKVKKQYEDSYLKGLEKDPAGRLRSYKQNASELIQVIVNMATAAAAKAVAAAPQKAAMGSQAKSNFRSKQLAQASTAAPAAPEPPAPSPGRPSARGASQRLGLREEHSEEIIETIAAKVMEILKSEK